MATPDFLKAWLSNSGSNMPDKLSSVVNSSADEKVVERAV
ncbi:hypothetical protein PNIG_a0856 [Pseudoalteromonas nigrifaciens]|uniref:Uncharacterized protein n=1 Tax=Pseudoalteromonas nigrifaciens TaxID=28109 RepID=A0AAC9UGQ3_9GAMM|nr:hypothetical protein PNIG_a0856 [Pseudoalteromonas nigrifaciens]